MRFKMLVSVLGLLVSISVNAMQVADANRYLLPDRVEVYELDEQGELLKMVPPKSFSSLGQKFIPGGRLGELREVIGVANQLVALGERLYRIVEKGRPVYNETSEAVSVLPRRGDDYISAQDLSHWSAPVVKKYRIVLKNLYGIETAAFSIMLLYSHSGTDEGRGKYITGAQIKPYDVNVMWGYSLNVCFKLQSVISMGSKQNPIAGAVLELEYQVSTVLQTRKSTESFFITGVGKTVKL